MFILVPPHALRTIAGYFTLCAYGLAAGTIPDAARKHIPRYPVVSATLLGRLAISKEFQGQRLGSDLLAEPLRKAYDYVSIVGSCMVIVDAMDDRAVRFYLAHGFIKLPESMRLILPIQAISAFISP